MKPLKIEKNYPGVYSYSFENDLTFQVILLEDLDRVAWIYKNKNNDYEGGDDWFYTKREALAALCDYIAHRKYSKTIGWHYVP